MRIAALPRKNTAHEQRAMRSRMQENRPVSAAGIILRGVARVPACQFSGGRHTGSCMRKGVLTLIGGLALAGLCSCDNSDERKARYAEKKPAPRPLERTFDAPRQVLPEPAPKENSPVWMEYKGEDIRQLTELSGRRVLIVFYAPWSRQAMQYVQAVKTYAAAQNGSSFAVLVNADEYRDLARKNNLEAVPMTQLYLEGMKLKEMVGSLPATRLNEVIEQTVRVP